MLPNGNSPVVLGLTDFCRNIGKSPDKIIYVVSVFSNFHPCPKFLRDVGTNQLNLKFDAKNEKCFLRFKDDYLI